MYITKNKLFTIILVLFFGTSVFSQFKINEYSCANVSAQVDAFGTTPDWFEIYNPTTSARSIAGYYVSNDINQKGMWQFPINTTIPSKGFLLVYASGFDTVIAGEYHTNFDLLQSKGDKIILSNNTGAVVDSITIKRHQHNHAWARIPDGGGTWKIFARNAFGGPTSTPGTTNVVTGLKSYKDYLPTPTFDLAGGFYSGPTQLSLSRPSTTVLDLIDPQIYYTGSNFFTGADPSVNGTIKRQFFDPTAGTPIYIDSTTVIRAYLDTNNLGGTANGYLPSFMATHTYFINNSNVFTSTGLPINTDFTLPTVSITYDTTTVGAYPGNAPLIPHNYMVSMEYYDKHQNFKFQTVGTAPPTSADDALPFSLGGINYYADDEYGYSYINKQQFYTDANLKTSTRTEQTNIIFRAAADDKFPLEYNPTNKFPTHMRDAMAQTYAMKNNLDIDGSRYQPCIMYLNGKYWGVYEIREAFDPEYVKYYYGIDPKRAQELQRDGILQGYPAPQAAYDWGNLVTFITTQTMNNDSLLAMADSMLNFKSLIDLIIYNSYTVNGEFPNKAIWWRAPDTATGAIKWRYHMDDMDDIYGLGDNNSGLANQNPDASNCQYQNQFGTITDSSMAHLNIFNSLMLSDTFKAQFINRYSYLLNTSLKCAPVIAHLTYIRNLLSPEMAQHTAKWGQTDTVWNMCVDTMKYWINQRCGALTDDIKSCYNVTGPLRFCTEIYPQGAGSIILNTVTYPEDHSDLYFGNVYFQAVGSPAENYYFDHWEPTDFTLPDSILRRDSIQWKFDSVSCLKAVFKLKEPYNLVGEPIVPTGFSPNGDGNNDLLNVYGTRTVTDFLMEVYNRWGQRVFESTDKTKGWDGKYNGADAPVGVYAYTFKVTLDGKIIQKSGSITLIR